MATGGMLVDCINSSWYAAAGSWGHRAVVSCRRPQMLPGSPHVGALSLLQARMLWGLLSLVAKGLNFCLCRAWVLRPQSDLP